MSLDDLCKVFEEYDWLDWTSILERLKEEDPDCYENFLNFIKEEIF